MDVIRDLDSLKFFVTNIVFFHFIIYQFYLIYTI